jgi:hypothetical protein
MISQENFLCGLTGLSQKCNILEKIKRQNSEFSLKTYLYVKKTCSLNKNFSTKFLNNVRLGLGKSFICFSLAKNKKLHILMNHLFNFEKDSSISFGDGIFFKIYHFPITKKIKKFFG